MHGAGRAAHGEREHERPDQVPLLLDGERPEVLEDGGPAEGVEVALPVDDVPPVGDVEEGGDDVAAEAVEGVGHEQHGPRGDDEEHEVQRRQQAPPPPQPELAPVDAAGAFPLLGHERRDQVAAHDEEDVHAEEAARDPGEPEVEEHHGRHGDGADAVQGRAVPHRRSRIATAGGLGHRSFDRGHRTRGSVGPPAPQSGAGPSEHRLSERSESAPGRRRIDSVVTVGGIFSDRAGSDADP